MYVHKNVCAYIYLYSYIYVYISAYKVPMYSKHVALFFLPGTLVPYHICFDTCTKGIEEWKSYV